MTPPHQYRGAGWTPPVRASPVVDEIPPHPPAGDPAACGHTTTGGTGIQWICVAARHTSPAHYYTRRYTALDTQENP